MKNKLPTLSKSEISVLLDTLKQRFELNMHRHPDVVWKVIENRLASSPTKLWSVQQMEITGGEPDIIQFDKNSDQYLLVDCSKESPIGRRSLCYDQAALDSRKANKPKDSATHLATKMGIRLLTEHQYRALQALEQVDLKTSSWIDTPPEIRKLGGALFCDRRYDQVFLYHNGAESYYAARGFRGYINI